MNTRYIFKTVILIYISIFSNFAVAFTESLLKTPILITQGDSYKLKSKILGEERNIVVRLPKSYKDSGKSFPVLYLTDGENHFGHGVSAVSVLEEHNMMPESIIIGIPNMNGTRLRDLVYESNKYIEFIKNELKPFVKSNFRTNNIDILFGHSSAGGFTLNIFREHSELFSSYITASPSISMKQKRILKYKALLSSRQGKVNKSLYIAMGGKADELVAINPNNISLLVKLLETDAPNSISWTYDYHPEQNHMTSPYLALFRGLSWVYKDYQYPTFINYHDYKAFGGIKGLKKHFENRHQKYQTSSEIPEDVLVGLGFTFIKGESYDQAIKVLDDALKLYPASYGAYHAQGTLYMKQKNITLALHSFEQALRLAEENLSPHLSYFRKQVEIAKDELSKD